MHYLIFIPNKTGPRRQNLADAGLGDLLRSDDDAPLWCDLEGRGPGDLAGQIWTWGVGDAIPAYLPDRQTWTPDKLGRYWFGIATGNPPKPIDLVRRTTIDGLSQIMADGSEWVIPNLFRLPSVFDLDDQDEVIKVPHPRFKSYVDESAWALEAVIDGLRGADFDWKRALNFVVAALSINYRISLGIAVQMGIVSESMLPTIMSKATDAARVRGILEDLKKTAVASGANG